MLTAKIDPAVFTAVIKSMGSLAKEANFVLMSEGIAASAMDGSGSAYVSMVIKKEAFKEFTNTGGKLGIDLVQLVDLLGDFEGELTITTDDNTRKLMMSDGHLNYGTRLLDPNIIKESDKPRKLPMPVKITLPLSEMKKAIKAVKKVADTVDFTVAGGVFSVKGTAQLGDAKYAPGNCFVKSTAEDNKIPDITATYTLDFIETFLKSVGGDVVIVEFNTDFPARLSYSLAEGNAIVTFMLAPRIEDR